MKYDLIIIGAGPAGISAAIYAVRNRLNTIVISKDIGGQMSWSGIVENYPGYSSLTGPELTDKFFIHAKGLGTNFVTDEVISVTKFNDIFEVKTLNNNYEAISVIISSGKNPKMLNIPGENEFLNRGVVYCATCDGPLFNNRDIAIIGGGNSALDAASQMVNIAKKIYIINKNSYMKGDQTLFEKVKKAKNVEFIYNALTTKIIGNRAVESITFVKDNDIHNIAVEGVFVQIGLLPNTSFIDISNKNVYGEIISGHENKTNIDGLFVAGDVTDVFEKQIVIAAGEGAKASLAAFKYITLQK
jgi:alkyl hydroperoxide reductase subunit F